MLHEYVTWFTAGRPATDLMQAFRRETDLLLKAAPQAVVDRAWLLQRFRHECSTLGIPCACFDFAEDYTQDYLALVRQTRDQMGAAHFNLLTRALNVIGTGVLPSLEDVSHLQRQDLRAAEGRASLERDDFAFVRARQREKQHVLEERVTRAFYTCLEALCNKGPVVFILDSYQQIPSAVEQWIHANLLTWAYHGHLAGLVMLMAGQGERPALWPESVGQLASPATLGSTPWVEYVCSIESFTKGANP